MIKEEIIEEFSEILKESGLQFMNNSEQEQYLKLIKEGYPKPLRTLLPCQKANNKSSNSKCYNNNSNTYGNNNTTRGWKTTYTTFSNSDNPDNSYSKIEIKTRSDQPSLDSMPERLYSSLKYEVSQEISSKFYTSAVLMCKVEVVNPFDSDEVITKQGGKSILKGSTELIPLTMNSKKTALHSKTKIQFLSVSFHHENKYFGFKFSYFNPENLSTPILIQVSAPFQVFARRPRRKISKKKEKEKIQMKK